MHARSDRRRGSRATRTGVLAAGMIVTAGMLSPTAYADTAHQGVAQPPAAGTVTDCAALAGLTVPRIDGHAVAITDAALTPASATAPGACTVRGTITVTLASSSSTIHFETKLPANTWNHQYVQVGGGGFCGSVPTAGGAGDDALARGFAVASDDTGHVGSSGDGSFAYNNPAAELTWGRLSEHLTAKVSKTIVASAYGNPVQRSYFVGCSTGGRQALVLAQQFPTDFNGIVAGAPALHQNELATLSQGVRELENHDSTGKVILDTAAAAMIKQQVIAQCDGQDGLQDGVIADPSSCTPDLDSLLCSTHVGSRCLTQAQIDVARKWYDSPRLPSGAELYPGGLPVGSEGGWPGYDIGTGSGLSGGGNYAQEVLRYLAYPTDPGPSYSLYDFNPATDAARLHTMDSVYNADSTDMTAFKQAGGKLIMWQGLADPLITPFGTIRYYNDVVKFDGGSLANTQKWFRSYFLPGVYHCTGGPGPSSVDWLGAISDWVGQGQQPERLVATTAGDRGTVTMRRPLYPYPLEARYSGNGGPNVLTSFYAAEGTLGR
ncbi:MAG: tannase/feruloyl esterase family alpha/beta hydrolase [Mycobacteriaceae bacterium]